ncbi:MAG: hypothetical protein KJP07_05965 [Desulfatitalea sp.]|nr:hypothetical protein [Desulfatitalea sp.]
MISENCTIEEFVKAVKGKDSYEVINLAVQEATEADRMALKIWKDVKNENIQNYSSQLKQLINYHRYMIKPRRKAKTVYNLYMKYWGEQDQILEGRL